jgi:membrane-associated phospholipid phosphatase
MIRKLCSMLLLGGSFLSPAFAQNNELIASAIISRTTVGEASNETTVVSSAETENSVLIPELNEKARLSFKPDFTIRPTTDPFKVRPRSFIAPAGLIAIGTYSLFSGECQDINSFAKESIGDKRDKREGFVPDHPMMFLPFVAYYGLNAAGIKGQHKVVDASLIYILSTAITNTIVFTTKNRSAIERPDASDLLSFPSGHTAQAFVSAEFLRQEYKHVSPWYGVAGYAAAVTTGALRMRHNKHWLNDVVAGAGVGILSTRVSYWLYSKIKKLVMPDAKSDVMIAPSYSNGAVGLSFMYSFK